jgi:[acyl-carrier-protein] S-malonyltransferase
VSIGVLFPGQGSQTVGMGADLFDLRPELLGEASDDVLGWSLRDMCLNGPEELLTLTQHAQPAIFALSYALWDVMTGNVGVFAAGAAGHSLGEYTALAAAEFFTYPDALKVVTRRGLAMATAAEVEASSMAALIGADEETAFAIAAKRVGLGGRMEVANINAPGQIVVAGSADDIDWLIENSRDLGVRRAIRLNVAAGFHSSFMALAQDGVASALEQIPTAEMAFPVWSNTTAEPHIRNETAATLVRQIVSPVRFSESLEKMFDSGISKFVHVGPGDVTAGMARRTLPDAEVVVVSSAADIPTAVSAIGTMT